MKRPQSIHINIPNPCSQNWDEMTPSGNGRHCTHCRTTVIDFTTWTDAELYKFFTKGNGNVCGRYLSTQLNRRINIPPQPHSRLYRMIVAMGLTLLFTSAKGTYGQIKSPLVNGKIKGHIVSVRDEPKDKYAITVMCGDKVKAQVYADKNGDFEIAAVDTGYYMVEVSNEVWDMSAIVGVRVAPGETAIVTVAPEEIFMGKMIGGGPAKNK